MTFRPREVEPVAATVSQIRANRSLRSVGPAVVAPSVRQQQTAPVPREPRARGIVAETFRTLALRVGMVPVAVVPAV